LRSSASPAIETRLRVREAGEDGALDQLFERSRAGDPRARERLISHYLPLARTLAARYARSNESRGDLTQVASLALVKAVDRFDPDRGIGFPAFATPTILGEIKRYFRDHGRTVRLPRVVHDRLFEVQACERRLAAERGHSPTVEDVAAELSISVEDALEAFEARTDVLSLDLPAHRDSENGESWLDGLGSDDPALERVTAWTAVTQSVGCLDPRSRQILAMRFFEDMTQSEIADRLGISQMHVSRLLRRALARLREATVQRT
jgi:RNA polymerase sigma-B factor